MDLDLNGRAYIVTGGSDGLGRALAAKLAAEGAGVAICGRDPGRLERAAEAIGERALPVAADVTVPADVERLVAAARERWGRLDGVVNNAGARAAAPFEEVGDDAWQADLDLKLLAAARLCRAALPALREAPAAAIVNILNIAAKAPPAGSLPTSASRAAGLALTKALAGEVAADGIRVNAILVGFVESGQWEREAAAAGTPVEEHYDQMASRLGIPLGRVGRSEEFADLAAFLLSPRAGYVTGAAVPLDGGLSPAA